MFSCLLGSHRYLDIRHRDRRLGIIADDRVGRILSALIDSCERRPVNDDIAELPVARVQKCLAGFLSRLPHMCRKRLPVLLRHDLRHPHAVHLAIVKIDIAVAARRRRILDRRL